MESNIYKFFLIIFFSFFIFSCSLDSKTGIWKNKLKKQEQINKKLIKLSNIQNKIETEINPRKKIHKSFKL